MNSEETTPQPLEVWLWDEVSGEWGAAYPRIAPDDNIKVHEATAEFIDNDLKLSEDQLKYRVNVEGVGINIGFFGRHMRYIELWGDRAERMVKLWQKKPEYWYPDTSRDALSKLTELHDLAKETSEG